MRKTYLFLVMALLLMCLFPNGVFCADGDEISTTSFRVDGNGEVWYQALNEIMSTNDTVTAAESGKVFIISDGGGFGHVKMVLPAADEGLTYTFVQMGTGTLIELDPNGTDVFLYSTATAGDRIIGPATAGASVTIHASDDTKWFVDANGTFTVLIDSP